MQYDKVLRNHFIQEQALVTLIVCVSQLCPIFCRPLLADTPPDSIVFDQSIRTLIQDYCITCHSTEKQEGELDLERFRTWEDIKRDAEVWERVEEQLTLGEMPPQDASQLPAATKELITAWIQKTLHDIALSNAGDPGPVVLRRLSNHEYTYTLRDLTGIKSLDPAKEFPVDGAAGEGFTNVGSALAMSPALLGKYLDAAKEVSRHLVLLDDGIRFSESDSAQDWTDEALAAIQAFYARYTTAGEALQSVQQGVSLDLGTETGRLPLERYLDALQGRGETDGLNTKYLQKLRNALENPQPSPLLAPLCQKYRDKELHATDIEVWQKVLWRFTTVGHIGKVNGPKAWQEPVSPLVGSQDLRWKLDGDGDQTLFLVATNAGDGDSGDQVQWENARLVAQGRPDIPVQKLEEAQRYLELKRQQLIEDSEVCLAAIESGSNDAPSSSLAIWREYLGYGTAMLEPLITGKMQSAAGYDFIQGWTGENALSVVANSSANAVRIPGMMAGHSVATHPAPDRASVIAWRSSTSTRLSIKGSIQHAHPECGNGVEWSLEVRRGLSNEQLAKGYSQGSKELPFGPFEDVRVEPDQVVALVIAPRDGNHSCDLTAVSLTLSDQEHRWDLVGDVSQNILAGNPNGPWYFISQPITQNVFASFPEPIAQWCKDPSASRAAKVRDYLTQEFPLTHPLLGIALRSFQPSSGMPEWTAIAPFVQKVNIPAELAKDATFVVTGRLVSPDEGSVQMQIVDELPKNLNELVAGQAFSAQDKAHWSDNQLSTQYSSPIVVNENSEASRRFEAAFEEFRSLFPIALCYERIVPVDEVVTLTLYHREDELLQQLMLSQAEAAELDRLWNHLRFVSNSPLKQVDAFEQLWQFATQDADPSAFEPLREPLQAQAEVFRNVQQKAIVPQKMALIDFAARAWRRPLTSAEIADLQVFPPHLMLVRILTSPSFLYRGEIPRPQTGPIDDWALATRLSYFLWSSIPDDELRQLAAEGKLRDPDVLAEQAKRMLKNERKIRRLATEFGCQYLHVRDVATLDEKSERHFPTFVDVREDLQEEVIRFFTDLVANNRPVLSIIEADHSFLNRQLADHYGVPISGDDWQRVEGMSNHGRGGILGFGAVLAKHSGASRTSAILRGMWLSEFVLGEKTPDPPKGVPTLPEVPPEGLTERQLIERHSSDPACAGCHLRIDPYGFALEGFDAIGRTRQADTNTQLFDGTRVDGMSDLRGYLIHQRGQSIVKQFSRKLLGYALGRSIQLSDQPLIEEMASSQDIRVADLVEHVVRSRQFQEIRGSSASENL